MQQRQGTLTLLLANMTRARSLISKCVLLRDRQDEFGFNVQILKTRGLEAVNTVDPSRNADSRRTCGTLTPSEVAFPTSVEDFALRHQTFEFVTVDILPHQR
jgi:hypothetical protein